MVYLQNFSIFRKLLIAFTAVTVVSVGTISVVYYFTFKDALIQRTTDQLISINILKKIQVVDYFKETKVPSIGFLEYVMQERTGMGNSGESYIVGADSILITKSRFMPNKLPRTILAATKGVGLALSGKSGSGIYLDYRGKLVIGAFGSIAIGSKKFALLSEMDFEEAMRPVYRVRNYFLFFGGGVIIIITMVCVWLAKLLSSPIKNISYTIKEISQGKLPKMVFSNSGGDEISEMESSLQLLVYELQRKTVFAQKIGLGEFDYQIEPIGKLDELGHALAKMRVDLLRLQEAEKKLIRLRSASILEGEERERKRLAMDLHDGLGQLLTALKFRVESLDDGEPTKIKLREILNEAILEVRIIAHNVMPAVLMDFGLEAALKQLSNTLEKEAGLAILWRSEIENNDVQVDFAIQICLYRIAQEAFTNIIKYAEAKEITVLLKIGENMVTLYIRDDGIGFNQTKVNAKQTNGLRNMRERAKMLNGKFTLNTTEGNGTHIWVEIPNNN